MSSSRYFPSPRVILPRYAPDVRNKSCSEYCTSLAEAGYIVAAIESRDGSGPISIVTVPDSNDKEDETSAQSTKEKIIDYLRIEDIV